MAVVVSHPLEVRELPDKTVLPVGGVVRGVYAPPARLKKHSSYSAPLTVPERYEGLGFKRPFPTPGILFQGRRLLPR